MHDRPQPIQPDIGGGGVEEIGHDSNEDLFYFLFDAEAASDNCEVLDIHKNDSAIVAYFR